jgi:hypothetical protein
MKLPSAVLARRYRGLRSRPPTPFENCYASLKKPTWPSMTQRKIIERYSDLAAPIGAGEIAALRKDSDWIEIVPHSEYLNDLNRERWY